MEMMMTVMIKPVVRKYENRYHKYKVITALVIEYDKVDNNYTSNTYAIDDSVKMINFRKKYEH